MKRKSHSRAKKLFTLFLVLVVLLTTGLIIFKPSSKPSADKPVTPQPTVISEFSFDATLAPDWRKGPSNRTSMALFYKPADCFVSFEHRTGPVDEKAELLKTQTSLEDEGYKITSIADPMVMLTLPDSKIGYIVHQSGVAGAESSQSAYRSQEFAYIPISGGYIFIQGYCSEPPNLPATIAALSAVSFTP